MKFSFNKLPITYKTSTVVDREHRKVHSETVASYDGTQVIAYGVAKCHPDDKFDEVLGRKLARFRSQKTAAKLMARVLRDKAATYADLYSRNIEKQFEAMDSAQHLTDLIHDLVNSTKHK